VPSGWTEASRNTYTKGNLYDYINGGAERYLRHGFEKLYAARYTNGAADELTLDLYDMGTPENAKAVFQGTRLPSPSPLPLCHAALGHEYGLIFQRGRVYGEISLSKADPRLREAAQAFARAVCGK